MNIQPNAYEINKAYRQDQEIRSERQRLADALQEEKPSIWASINMPSILIIFASSGLLLVFFVWSFMSI